jgi:hypothetical protein
VLLKEMKSRPLTAALFHHDEVVCTFTLSHLSVIIMPPVAYHELDTPITPKSEPVQYPIKSVTVSLTARKVSEDACCERIQHLLRQDLTDRDILMIGDKYDHGPWLVTLCLKKTSFRYTYEISYTQLSYLSWFQLPPHTLYPLPCTT